MLLATKTHVGNVRVSCVCVHRREFRVQWAARRHSGCLQCSSAHIPTSDHSGTTSRQHQHHTHHKLQHAAARQHTGPRPCQAQRQRTVQATA